MFPLSNFVYLFSFMFVFSMSIETTDDCGQDPYETGCLVETFPGLIKIIYYVAELIFWKRNNHEII